MNFLARHTLIGDHASAADQFFSVGVVGAKKLVSQDRNFKRLNFPKIMTERGFPEDESDGVKNFFYRSDGYKLWNIFSRYVSGMVNTAFLSDEAVIQDDQLQQFASSVANKNQGNVPGFPSVISTRSDLIEVLTSVIFASSVMHQV